MILTYLIKSTLCFGILFGFYKVALEHKAMHQFKRFYLLASLIFALTIPLITFTYSVEALPEPPPVVDAYEYYSNLIISEEPIPVKPTYSLLPILLWSIYGLGVIIFGTRFILNLVRLKRKINTSQQLPKEVFTLSLLEKSIVPHSFLKWIFLNKTAYQNQEIATEVLAHEATHVREKHSWDILFIEFLQIFFWFNPFIWVSKKSIKLNHEFLADQGAIDNKSNIAIYQNILLSYASSTDHTALESPFNYSLTKKRILMMSQTFSRKRVALSALLLIPIVGLCTFLFNNEIKAQPEPTQSLAASERNITARNVNITIITQNDFIVNGKNATRATIVNTLSTFNQDLTKQERDRVINFHIRADRDITPIDLRFLQKVASDYGYHRILANEKEEIVRAKNNHPAYDHPTNQDLQEWQKKKYTLFLDDEKIRNEEIKAYHVDDLPYFYSKELQNGKKEIYIWTNPFWQNKRGIGFRSANSQENQSYATTFMKGARANDKKPLVIEIKNDKITINGKQSTLATFSKDVDAITKDWEETDYTEPALTYMIKGNSENFLKKLETEYAKTHISRANGGAGLIPPPPPPPPTPQSLEDLPAPPPPPSVEDHLFKMNRLGGEFYYNDTKITYSKAKKLIKDYEDLNVKTPYPYSTPPQTFLTKQPEQKPKLKIGDTLTITVTESGEQHRMILQEEPSDQATRANVKKELELAEKLKLEYTSQKPATKKEIAIYNKLATKYNKDPEGIIKQGEVIRMYDIYSRMTPKQKKAAQPYPVLPPPPPPPPADVDSVKIRQVAQKTKKETAKFKFSSTKESVNEGTQYAPNFSIYPQNQDQLAVEIHSSRIFNWDGMRFFENDVELTKSEAGAKIASDNYFMDIGPVIPGTSKQKVVFTKKPWARDTKTANSQGNNWDITTSYKEGTSKESHLTNLIERHAMSNGIFEINGNIISKEEAIQSLNQSNISLGVKYRNGEPYKMILNKDHITGTFDIYYEGKLLTEDEYNNLAGKPSLELKKIKDKTNTSKAQFRLIPRN